ncbi:MAG: toll/interleukin-1 receptor domain-containing protein, partial [Chloroflexota bacterium]|nr:toll/interleukin-1 receptor domain-containing protein [Chloroflexota bacterium]
GYTAHLEREWLPGQTALSVELQAIEGGSVIFAEATGYIPGIKGRLNPIRDSHERTYLYAASIAINEGMQQPVHFVPGEVLRVTDADGSEILVRIVAIVGRSALVEYRPCPE